jgi:transcriptional regulator with XRE-family HTH domain
MPRRDPLLTALGLRVRELREAQGLTQEQPGEKADLDQTYISDIERGERNPSVLIVGQLAKAFPSFTWPPPTRQISTQPRKIFSRCKARKSASGASDFNGTQSGSPSKSRK